MTVAVSVSSSVICQLLSPNLLVRMVFSFDYVPFGVFFAHVVVFPVVVVTVFLQLTGYHLAQCTC
jgi:hypothetical protein